jgi:hypothetical protein
MYEQRRPEGPPPATEGAEQAPWRPTEDAFGERRRDPLPGDRYVAVDRVDGPVVTLATAPWPSVDPATGRFDFGPRAERTVATVTLEALQRRVDLDRAAAPGQVVRPIRPGDAFLVAGYSPDPSAWIEVVDVTRSARIAAKAALLATAAPAPAVDELDAYGLDRGVVERGATAADDAAEQAAADGDQPPPGPVAYPAV